MIEAKDVVKTFRGGALAHRRAVEAVRGVSLALEEGRTYALVGESGSGKTTLTHLLTGCSCPTAAVSRWTDGQSRRTRRANAFGPYSLCCRMERARSIPE